MSDAGRVLQITITQQEYPRYDPAHGTPDPMVRRLATIETARGEARFEQTDYGHPGRFNPWDARGIAAPLQPQTEALRALCESLGPLLA
jgi:hypothetical protein